MPCRPKLCQRLAAQLTHPPSTNASHIWISDDLLSEAFNRYVHVSHASRRYGSHVPGPLEHRRRLAKRKMGCAAVGVGAPSMPPGGDFGALFGHAGAGSGWKWEAPGLSVGEPPLKKKVVVEEWDWGIGPQHMAEPAQEAVDPVKASKEAYHALNRDLMKLDVLDEHDLEPMFEFFQSTRDEPGAGNMHSFLRGLGVLAMTPEAVDAFAAFLREQVELGHFTREHLRRVYGGLPQMLARSSACEGENAAKRVHEIYRQIWHANPPGTEAAAIFYQLRMLLEQASDYHDLHKSIDLFQELVVSSTDCPPSQIGDCLVAAIKGYAGLDPGDKQLFQDRLKQLVDQMPESFDKAAIFLGASRSETFIRYLPVEMQLETVRTLVHALDLTSTLEPGHSNADEIYAFLSRYLHPIDLAPHWAKIKSIDLCRVLLRSWLPNTDLDALVSGTRDEIEALLDTGDSKQLHFSRQELSHDNLPLISEWYETFCDELYFNTANDKTHLVTYPYVHLLRAFAAARVRYDRFAQILFQTLQATFSPSRVHNVFSAVYYHKDLAMPTPAAVGLINHLLASATPTRALSVFRTVPSVCITDVPNLLLELIKKNHTQSYLVFECLNRQPHRIQPRDRVVERLNIPQAHIDFAHVVARVLSQHASLRSRVAFRRVWTIYRWLQDRGAALQPLLTRALMHSGIIRPLQERQNISNLKIKFIVELVARVEGQQVAAHVDRLAYVLRRKTYPEVSRKKRLRRWAALRNPQDAGMIRHAKYRVRLWTKKRPIMVLQKDGEIGFVVPGREKRYEDGNLVPYWPLDELAPITKVLMRVEDGERERERETLEEARRKVFMEKVGDGGPGGRRWGNVEEGMLVRRHGLRARSRLSREEEERRGLGPLGSPPRLDPSPGAAAGKTATLPSTREDDHLFPQARSEDGGNAAAAASTDPFLEAAHGSAERDGEDLLPQARGRGAAALDDDPVRVDDPLQQPRDALEPIGNAILEWEVHAAAVSNERNLECLRGESVERQRRRRREERRVRREMEREDREVERDGDGEGDDGCQWT